MQFVNKSINQENPSETTLKVRMLVINIANIVVDVATLAYFSVAMIRLHSFYNNQTNYTP